MLHRYADKCHHVSYLSFSQSLINFSTVSSIFFGLFYFHFMSVCHRFSLLISVMLHTILYPHHHNHITLSCCLIISFYHTPPALTITLGDIVCLQEVQSDHYEQHLNPFMQVTSFLSQSFSLSVSHPQYLLFRNPILSILNLTSQSLGYDGVFKQKSRESMGQYGKVTNVFFVCHIPVLTAI